MLAGIPFLVHVTLESHVAPALDPWLRLGSGLSHAALFGGLLLLFAGSLRRGRTDLVTVLHRRFQSRVPPRVARYTRGVTIAWSLFFAGQLLGSALLLGFASPDAWSLFVNVLDLPLVALMFAAEFACRRVLLRGETRIGPADAIQRLRHPAFS